MKELLSAITFTLRSIIFVGIIILFLIGRILFSIDFETKSNLTISIIGIVVLIILFTAYTVFVLLSYYHLPNMKKSNSMGVLFYINTHNDSGNYKSIKNKFFEQFNQLSNLLENNKLCPIILTQKQISVIKNIHDKEVQFELLKKTNCIFGAFIVATDEGNNSDSYQLKMDAMIVHPTLPTELERTLKHNFNYVFNQNLHLNTLNKKNDLVALQTLGSELYCICQLMYGVANLYSGHYLGALNLYWSLYMNLKQRHSRFYRQISEILEKEICTAVIVVNASEYNRYITDGIYDVEKVDKSLNYMNQVILKLGNPDFTINYYLTKATCEALSNKLTESKKQLEKLNELSRKFPTCKKICAYSDAFLCAAENKEHKYWDIYKKYKRLKNNNTQDVKKIFDFINMYSIQNPKNLGVKLALIFLVHFKNLPHGLLPDDFRFEILTELESVNKELSIIVKKINEQTFNGKN